MKTLVNIFLVFLALVERNVSAAPSPLIVGGMAATRGQFPYQLALKTNRQHTCGATLVTVQNTQVALTSAQCVSGSIFQYTLTAGEFDLDLTNDTTTQIQDIMRIYIHPGYSSSSSSKPNDIAVLFIRNPFQVNDFVKPVNLPEVGRATSGNLTVSGWGRLWDGGPYPNLLHYVTMPVVNITTCKTAWEGYGENIIDGQLCAGDADGSQSACSGDVGGPAVDEEGYLSGIVSWGWGCGHPQYPGVFTRVSQYVEWVNDVVNIFNKNTLI